MESQCDIVSHWSVIGPVRLIDGFSAQRIFDTTSKTHEEEYKDQNETKKKREREREHFSVCFNMYK